MRRVLVLWALMVMSLGVAAGAAPRMAVDLARYDFPDTVEGLAVVHTFVVSNMGDQDLVIESAAPSCHCTTIAVGLASNRLQPGQSVNLNAILDTNGLSGHVTKTLTLTSNDPGADGDYKITLSFVGTIAKRQAYQESVSDLLYDSYILLDVRDPVSYAAGHLIGAMNVPASQAADVGASLPPSALAIIYDQGGAPAFLSTVAQALHGAGVAAVYSIAGGLDRWRESYGSARMTSGTDTTWGSFLDVSETRNSSSSTVVGKYDAAHLLTDYVLIDIRAASAFAAGHLAGAVNLPEASVGAYIDALPQETPVIVYSADGADSERVVYSLWMRDGRVKSLLGGFDEWRRLNGDSLLVSSPG